MNNITRNHHPANRLTAVLLGIYLIALYWILILKLGVRFSYMGKRSVNLIPYRQVLLSHGKADMGEIVLNVLVFIPLGMYAGALFARWSLAYKLLFIFLTSLLVEVLQFTFSVGAFDLTDIINNTVGGMTGLLIFKAMEKLFASRFKAQRFINIMAAIGTVLIVSLLLLLKMNLLPVRYQ